MSLLLSLLMQLQISQVYYRLTDKTKFWLLLLLTIIGIGFSSLLSLMLSDFLVLLLPLLRCLIVVVVVAAAVVVVAAAVVVAVVVAALLLL